MLVAAAEGRITGLAGKEQPLWRLPVGDLGAQAAQLSAKILHDRVLPFFEQHLPHVAQELFGRASELADLSFSFSPSEPAVNRYMTGGEFLVHHDAYSVTVNVLLSEPGSFVGGGTAFWSQDQAVISSAGPSVLLRPRQGTAAIFNGNVEHAGRPVESGIRHLYVASFHLS